jgi:hypothetical protein
LFQTNQTSEDSDLEEFNRLPETLKEPYRTMALVALFLGPE